MTDNRTTELREKLTERGVEWRSKDEELGLNIDGFHDTRWQVNGVLWCFIESGDNTCLAMCGEWKGCTPEQAISATLGGDDKSRWYELFGTPERAAGTLLDVCDNCGQNECSGCQVYELTSGGDLDYDALLDWLKGERK